jgi:3,4-dihydroxy 2-butanone 4-phosphate synthase/GTP cyclohydrolase II
MHPSLNPTISRDLSRRDVAVDRIEDALSVIRSGRPVIVADDEARENEGDFIGAAEYITPALVNELLTLGRGLLCVGVDGAIADRLNLPPMVNPANNDATHQTPFTVPVDHVTTTTGISADERCRTIRALADPDSRADDFVRPGHIFPLRAQPGGVLDRPGHTEAAVDLMKLTNLPPAGYLIEILKPNGRMGRLPYLRHLADKLGTCLITIDDLIAHFQGR